MEEKITATELAKSLSSVLGRIQYMERMDADPEYQGIVQRAVDAGLFIAGSLHETVLTSI